MCGTCRAELTDFDLDIVKLTLEVRQLLVGNAAFFWNSGHGCDLQNVVGESPEKKAVGEKIMGLIKTQNGRHLVAVQTSESVE